MKTLETSVRDQITLFLEGYHSVDMLNDLLPDMWEVDESDEPETVEIMMRAIGYLAEYQAGARQEEDVRDALAEYASWSIDRSAGSAVTQSPSEDSSADSASPVAS